MISVSRGNQLWVFSPEIIKFGKHSSFSSMEKIAFSVVFAAHVRLVVEGTFVKNRSNWSSGLQIP